MRITVVPEDGFVSVDNVGADQIDLSALHPAIHAIQWYDTFGEVEWKKTETTERHNEHIESFDNYSFVIGLHSERIAAIAAERPRKIGE